MKGRLLQKLSHSKLEKSSIALVDLLSKDRMVYRTLTSCFLFYIIMQKAQWSPIQPSLIEFKAF